MARRYADGFTIIEVMIAAGLLAVVSLMIASIMTMATKQQKQIVDRASQTEMVQATALDLRLHPVPTSSP
jgi:type II secretory pathway component PulJ